jgi:hypothetical protein
METIPYGDYRIELVERPPSGSIVDWTVRGFGRQIATGSAPTRPAAFDAAAAACEADREDPLRFPINLVEGGDVVTRDGEVIGRWELDEEETYLFFPVGATEPLLSDWRLGLFCADIREWHEARSTQTGA